MDLWYPNALQAQLKPQGGYVGGPFRGVLHTTEGGSYAGAFGAYKATGNFPHFTVTGETGIFQTYQHLPLNQFSTALMHPGGTIDTNRMSAIQIEIVGTAAGAPQFSPLVLAGLRDLMIWIETQTGINPTAPIFKPYPGSGGLNNGVRFSGAQWAAFNGWCGHQHVPGNDHGDPGALNMGVLLTRGTPEVVRPVFDPPLQIVDFLANPAGPGGWGLGPDGGIYGLGGCGWRGADKQPLGHDYWGNRHAAKLEANGAGYTVVATTGERYEYP